MAIKVAPSMNWQDYGLYEAKVTFTGTSDTIYLMPGNPTVSAAIHPTGGTAKIQYTLSSAEDIEAGNGRWLDWEKGANSVPISDSTYGSVVAIRGVNVTSTSSIVEVVCQ